MIATTIHRADPREHLNGIRAKDIADVVADLADEDDGAYLLDDGITRAWVPKCQVTDNDDGTFTMPRWLAIAKELI